jgi:hypothetical protein
LRTTHLLHRLETSMTSRSIWVGGSLIAFALAAGLHWWLTVPGGWRATATAFQLAYSAGYFVFGAAVLGTVARVWPHLTPPMWRLVALASAASLALVEWRLHGVLTGTAPNIDTWAAALLGVALSAMAPRLVPASVLHRWLGQDRRRVARM